MLKTTESSPKQWECFYYTVGLTWAQETSFHIIDAILVNQPVHSRFFFPPLSDEMSVVCVYLRRRLSVAFPSMNLAGVGLKQPDRFDLSHLAGRGSESCNVEYSDSCWGGSRN